MDPTDAELKEKWEKYMSESLDYTYYIVVV